MSIDLRRESPEIVKIDQWSAERNVSDSIVLNVSALSLYLLDTRSLHAQELPSLEELVEIMNTKIPGLVSGKDYRLNALGSTITLGGKAMNRLIEFAGPVQEDTSLDSTLKLQGRVLSYDQIVKFFGVARGLPEDILRGIFYLGLSKIFPLGAVPPLFPSPLGLYKNSPALKPHYQNLAKGYFLSEVLIQKLIEASRELMSSDSRALARFEANIRHIDIFLSFDENDG